MKVTLNFKSLVFLATSASLPLQVNAAVRDWIGPAMGTMGRYWDCCKPSCGWSDKGAFKGTPVLTCDIDDKPLESNQEGTGCNGGKSHGCSNNAPWAVSDELSYGFVGTFLKGGEESTWCCACYEFNFTSEKLKGKRMLVQTSNTNYDDVKSNIFNLAIPGGNYTSSPGCDVQFSNLKSQSLKDGVFTSSDDCEKLPEKFRAGCRWRFDWLLDEDRLEVNYTRITCPKELTDISKCTRQDDEIFLEKALGDAPKGVSAAMEVSSVMGLALAGWNVFF